MYGIQTIFVKIRFFIRFENDVKMYGIQTNKKCQTLQRQFENDVKMYGIQTAIRDIEHPDGLRMM